MTSREHQVDIAACAHVLCDVGDDPRGVSSERFGTVWTYRSQDPYAVHMQIVHAGGVTDWVLSRESITEGLSADSTTIGQGDVRITTYTLNTGSDVTVITLQSPSGALEISFDTYDLVLFITCTEDIVPPGAEVDLVVAQFDDQYRNRADLHGRG